jgi:PadR family transcriptional regulator PadR
MSDRDLLSPWEDVYLLSIWELKGEAYGVAIKRRVSRKTGRILSYGGLYFTLAQLVKKGLVVKTEGEPSPCRGGRRRFYYTLTERGKRALRTSFEFHRSLWRDVKEPVFD